MLKNDEGKKTTCCLYITAKLLSGDDNPDVTDIAALQNEAAALIRFLQCIFVMVSLLAPLRSHRKVIPFNIKNMQVSESHHSIYMFPKFVRACGWFACNARHDCMHRQNQITIRATWKQEELRARKHTLQQLIASSTRPASLSALPYKNNRCQLLSQFYTYGSVNNTRMASD